MPRLNNPTHMDLFAPQIHRTVPALGSVRVSIADAALFDGNSVFTITDTVGASERREAVAEAETRTASRRQVTRGSQRAEIDSAPPMETR